MAIDSMMALRTQVPDLGQAAGQGFQNAGSLTALRENKQMAGARKQAALSEMEMSKIKSYGIASAAMLPMLESGDAQGVVNYLTSRKKQLDDLGLDSADTAEAIELAQKDPETLKNRSLQAVDLYNQFHQGSGAEEPSQVREYKYWRALDDKGKKDFIDVKRSGFDAGGVQYTGSGRQIVSTSETANNKAAIAGAAKDAELDAEMRKLPDLKAAVSLAEADAKAKGETMTELSRAKAALPGLEQTISSLKELAPLVTYTYGGKVYDAASKQLGFGATEGSTARAKFISTVNNQVLPLLRDTFGAAFTAKEGEELKAAMADVDSSPEEKLAQLDAFIDQKYKQIQINERQLGQPSQVPQNDPLGIR